MKDQAQKAMFAMVGAPVVVSRQLAEVGARMSDNIEKEYEVWVDEGAKLTRQVRKSDVVEELSHRVDVEQLQEQVERLRDQLEGALGQWRETFRPEKEEAESRPATAPKTKTAPKAKAAPKTTAKKTTAKKTTAKKTTTSARSTAAKSTASKAATAKKAAPKETTGDA
jgi:hypothetical protein